MPRVRFSSLSAVPLLLSVLLLAGCGGGGGGTPSPGTIGVRVVTDWSAAGSGGGLTGASERIRVLKPNGALVDEKIVNAGTTTTTSSLQGTTGIYTVHIDLMSAADGGGTVVGSLDTTTVSGSTSFNVGVGTAVTSLRFAPSSVDIAIGDKILLGVVGVDANDRYTFLAPNSVTITGTGTAAAIAADGTATGVASGTTTVTATKGALHATALVNVAKAGTVRSKWTVMVYINASNDLYPYAAPNVNQMEKVAYNPDVRYVVQWKESAKLYGANNVDFDGTRRYLVKSDTTSEIKSQLVQNLGADVDMGSADTLKDFVSWTKQNYPADRYTLIIWNHGNGWQRGLKPTPPPTRAVSYDDEFGSTIDIWELPAALAGQRVDILSFDACLMQMLEIASEMKGTCDYIATSEENTPAPGYPYDRIFKAFADNPSNSTKTLSKSFVDGHVGYAPYQNQTVTQSVLDCTKIGAVETAVDELAGQLIAERSNLLTVIPNMRSAMSKYALRGDGRYFYDLVDLAQHLQATSGVPTSVKNAAASVITANNDAVIWEGHTSLDAFSHGIAIDFSPSTGRELDLYAKLNLAKTTRWDDWLKVAP